jgi:hypothetical protein
MGANHDQVLVLVIAEDAPVWRTSRPAPAWWMRLLKPTAQEVVQSVAEFNWQLIGLAVPVKGYGLADVIHHYLARVAASQMLLELLTNGGVSRAIHVFVQYRQQFFALHRGHPYILSRE